MAESHCTVLCSLCCSCNLSSHSPNGSKGKQKTNCIKMLMCLVLGKYIKMICRRAQGWRLGKLLKVWMFLFYLIIAAYPLTWKEQQRRHNSWRGRNVAVDNKILSWGWKRSWLFFCIPPFLWGGSISGPQICNVKISDCLCTVTVKVLISAVEMGDQDFSMFPATRFLLSPWLIYCSLCFGGVFFVIFFLIYLF